MMILQCQTGVSYSTLSSSPDPQDEEEDDPWADKTTELSFSGAAASQQQDRVGDAGAGDSSDEDNEAAPDKMEVDNDQDRKWTLLRNVGLEHRNIFSLGYGKLRWRGHGHQLLPLGHAHCCVQ